MTAGMGFDPVTIDFEVQVSFTTDSSFIPTTEEIDALIELAFLPPSVDMLIAEYNALPADSPFSSTQSVAYQALSGVIRDGLKVAASKPVHAKHISAAETSLVVGVSFLALLTFVLFIIWLRARRKRHTQSSDKTNVKSDLIAIMPAYSYCDSRSSNLMQFKDENSTGKSEISYRFKSRSMSSSMSSRTSSSVSIRAI
jgi:hypothetical protein